MFLELNKKKMKLFRYLIIIQKRSFLRQEDKVEFLTIITLSRPKKSLHIFINPETNLHYFFNP